MMDSQETKNVVLGLAILIGAANGALSATSAADQSEWKVGLAQVSITPEQPIFMAGYSSRTKPFEKVETDLFAKAMTLEDRNGYRAVLITSDLIGFRASIAEPICERICAQTGLQREQILINSSHTHTGPILSLDESPRDAMTAEDARRTVAYTRQLQDKVVDIAVRSLSQLEPAVLAWGVGVVHFPMNRRQFTSNRLTTPARSVYGSLETI